MSWLDLRTANENTIALLAGVCAKHELTVAEAVAVAVERCEEPNLWGQGPRDLEAALAEVLDLERPRPIGRHIGPQIPRPGHESTDTEGSHDA